MSFKIKYIWELVDEISPKIKNIQRQVDRATQSINRSAAKIGTSFDEAGKRIGAFGNKIRSVGQNLFLKTTLPLGFLARSFIKSASDYNESINKVDVAFGNAANSVKEFTNIAGQKFGIDRGSALDMAAMFGDMATGMGIAQKKAAELSTNLVGVAGDLASFKNIAVEQAKTALAAIFTGETESMKRLGIVMTQTNLQQFALSQGIHKKIEKMKQADLVLLRYRFVLDRAKNSLGDFARTSEGYANQQRILASRWKDLSITLGTILLPIATKLVNKLISIVEWFTALSPSIQKVILIVGGLAAVLAPVLILVGLLASGIGSLVTVLGVVATGAIAFVGAIKALTAAMLANPLGLFLTALVATIIYWNDIIALMKQARQWISSFDFSGSIQTSLSKASSMFGYFFDWIENKWSAIFNDSIFQPLFDQFDHLIAWFDDALSKISSIASNIGSVISNVFSGNFTDLFNGDKLSPVTKSSQQSINQNQQVRAGGEMNINVKGLPKGSSASITPYSDNFINFGLGLNYIH